MKNKVFAKILPFIITLLILSTTTQVQAALIWEEDFEEGIPDGWELDSYDIINGIYEPVDEPTISVVDGVLVGFGYQEVPKRLRAQRDSTVAYGTWSFDWLASSHASISINLIFNDPVDNFNWSGVSDSNYSVNGYQAFGGGSFGPSRCGGIDIRDYFKRHGHVQSRQYQNPART